MDETELQTLSYTPIPLTVPLVLAPSSRASSPSSSSAFTKHATALAGRLAASDARRRSTGLLHAAAPSARATRLLVTAFKGEVVGKPVWSTARDTDGEEERLARQQEEEAAWVGLGMEGLPRDEEEWAEWEERKAVWRRSKAAQEDDSDVEIVLSSPAKEADKAQSTGRKKKERRRSPSFVEEEEEVTTAAAKPARQPKLNALFLSSKSSVAVSAAKPSSSKKRPPTSPVPPPPARRSNSSSSLNVGSSKRLSSSKEGSPTEPNHVDEDETPQGRSNGRSLGEDEEILFEGGCTQMDLPSPTPHRPPSQQHPPSQPPLDHLHPNHHSSLAPPSHSRNGSSRSSPAPFATGAPFSSPGLNNPQLDRPPVAASTPFLTRKHGGGDSPSRSTSPSNSRSGARSRSPSNSGDNPLAGPSRPQTQLSTLATTAAGTNGGDALKPPSKLHRLSSIARTESQRSSIYGAGAEVGGGGAVGGGASAFDDAELSRFLDEDARD